MVLLCRTALHGRVFPMSTLNYIHKEGGSLEKALSIKQHDATTKTRLCKTVKSQTEHFKLHKDRAYCRDTVLHFQIICW